jgi:paraquat-inducible protein B
MSVAFLLPIVAVAVGAVVLYVIYKSVGGNSDQDDQ